MVGTLWRGSTGSKSGGGEKARPTTVVSRELQLWDSLAVGQNDSNGGEGALIDTLWRELPCSQSDGEESRFAIKDVENLINTMVRKQPVSTLKKDRGKSSVKKKH